MRKGEVIKNIRKYICIILAAIIVVTNLPVEVITAEAGFGEISCTTSGGFGLLRHREKKQFSVTINNKSGAEDVTVEFDNSTFPSWVSLEDTSNSFKCVSGNEIYITLNGDGTELLDYLGGDRSETYTEPTPIQYTLTNESGETTTINLSVSAWPNKGEISTEIGFDSFTYGSPSDVTIISDGEPLSDTNASYFYRVDNVSTGEWSPFSTTEELKNYLSTSQPGNYTLILQFNESDHYYSGSSNTVNFTISEIDTDISVSMNDIYYGQSLTAPNIAFTNTVSGLNIDDISYYYFSKSSFGKDIGIPLDIGTYYCNVQVSHVSIGTIKKSVTFDIKKMPLSVSVSDISYGQTINPVLTGGYLDDMNNYVYGNLSNDIFEFYYSKAGEDSYTNTVPEEVGAYDIKVINTDGIYEDATDSFNILAIDGGGSISISDVTYPDVISPEVASDKNGIEVCTIYYKKAGAADSTYVTTKPQVPGNYEAKAVFAANKQYKEYVAETTFTINKGTGSATVTQADAYAGETLSPKITSDCFSTEDATFYYKGADEAESAYTTNQPDMPGNYVVKADINDNAYYTGCKVYTTFELKKMPLTISIADIDKGESFEVVVTGGVINASGKYTTALLSADDYKIYYKKTGTDDSTYSLLKPTTVGAYTAKIEDESGKHESATTTFSILAIEGGGTISISDVTYPDVISPEVASDKNGIEVCTIYYKKAGADDSTYVTVKPEVPGSYEAKAIFEENEGYKKYVAKTTFTINKGTGSATVTQANVYAGEKLLPQIDSDCFSAEDVTYYYKGADEAESAYTTNQPDMPGSYKLKAEFKDNAYYNDYDAYATFELKKLPLAISIADINKGEALEVVVTGGAIDADGNYTNTLLSADDYKISYKKTGSDDSTYSVNKPVSVGEYTAKIEDESGKHESATTTFSILAIEGGGTISIPDVTYPEAINPIVTSDKNGVEVCTIYYKKAAEDDSTYVTTKPEIPGSYEAKAVFAANNGYKEFAVKTTFTINKGTGSATVTQADAYAGETLSPQITSDCFSADAVTFYYKGVSEAESAYTTNQPDMPGSYKLKAEFNDNAYYNAYDAYTTFELKKLPLAISIADINKGEALEIVVTGGAIDADGKYTNTLLSADDYKISYKKTGSNDSTYSVNKPVSVGEYTAKIEDESGKHESATTTFSILAIEGGGTISISDVTYPEAISPIVTSDKNGVEVCTIYYKKAGADDSTYVTTKPKLPGSYEAKAVFAANDGYKEYVAKTTFTINKGTGSAKITIADITYGEKLEVKLSSSDYNVNTAVVYFKNKGAADSTYVTTKPDMPGSYEAKAVFAETEGYKEYEAKTTFTISKKTGKAKITIADITYGEAVEVKLSSTDYDVNTAVVYFKKNGEADSTYVTTKPDMPGSYEAKAVFAENDKCKECQVKTTFSIKRITGKAEIKIADISYGEKLEVKLLSSDYDVNTAVVYFRKKGAADSTYVTTKPLMPGSYEAKAVFAENDKYGEYEAKTSFSIKKNIGKAEIKIADITYGEKLEVQLLSSDYNVDNAVVYFKKKGADDSTYVTARPEVPGSYEARAVFAENDKYNKYVTETQFVIEKAEGKGTVTVGTPYFGEKITSQIASDNYNVNEIQTYYKKAGQSDEAYTTEVPTEVGNYVMKVVFLTNSCYKESQCIIPFAIDYMPVPAYNCSGISGTNSFYTSNVVINAPAGYLVSTDINGTFGPSVVISENTTISKIYFKNALTGGITDAVSVDDIKIDTTVPVIDGAENGGTIVGANGVLKISDKNLASVKINGNVYTITGNSTELELSSNNETETYSIEVTDLAGNVKTFTVTVEAQWYNTGVIPSGEKVLVREAKSYKLGNGEWIVEGDDTVYAGGISFYVKETGEYTFIVR